MTVELSAELAAALQDEAKRNNTSPELLAHEILRQHLAIRRKAPVPRDAWEQQLLDAAMDCGVSLTNESVSSEGIYE